MGLIDDKKNIFTDLAALDSIEGSIQIPEEFNSIASINNSKEILPFLLDLLTVLIGSQVLENVLGELLTSFIRDIEPDLKDELKKQTALVNSDNTLPASFTSGYKVKVNKIDPFQKLRVDPSSQTGSLLYPSAVNDFDKKAYSAIINPGNVETFGNLNIEYDEDTDEFIFTPANSSQSSRDFFDDYIDDLILVNESEFNTNILDIVFGTIKKQQNKSLEQVINEEKIRKTLEKVINDNSEGFDLSDDEINQIQEDSENLVNGVNKVDVGCTKLNAELSINQIEDLVGVVTGSSDPLLVGNTYSSTLLNTFDDNENVIVEDENAIKDGFLKRIINAILDYLARIMFLTPQVRTLFAIHSAIKNNGVVSINNPETDIRNKKNLIRCLVNRIKSLINEFIFNLVKKELLNLIIPISKIILREKINAYLAIIRSLIPF